MTVDPLTSLGAMLRRHRQAAGLTQEELAERANVSAHTISDLERGVHRTPYAHTVRRLVEVLELTAADAALFIEAGRDAVLSKAAEVPHAPAMPTGGFLGAVPAGQLIGRRWELAGVQASAAKVANGTGELVLLAGEAGVGKTRLAQEITLGLRDGGFRVATGRCYEAESVLPFYPFLEVLESLYAGSPPELRAEAPRRWRHLLRLLPEMGLGPPGVIAEGQEEQQYLFRAVTGFVVALAQRAPLALLLDDLHWADTSSLALLVHLARFTRSYPLLLLGSYRDTEATRQGPLAAVIRELDREQLLTRMSVRRLDREETGRMIADSFDPHDVSDGFVGLIYERTEGNPFFVRQIVRAVMEGGDIYRENGQWTRKGLELLAVPESVQAFIGQRVSLLHSSTREVLYEASVLGQVFTFADLQTTTGRSETGLDEALQEAAQLGLLHAMDDDRYRFDHALTQQALYAELSPRRRARRHLEVGEALERVLERARAERAADLTWHFLKSSAPLRALPYAVLAGDRAQTMSAYGEAEEYYRTAVRLARESNDTRAEAESRTKLGMALHASGHFEGAIEELEGAARIFELLTDVQGIARVTAHIVGAFAHWGRPEEGVTRARSVLPTLECGSPCIELVDLYGALGANLFIIGEHDDGLAVARRAVAMAETLEDKRALASGKAQLGLALLTQWRRDEARQTLEEAIVLAEDVGDLSTLGSALNNAAWAYEVNGDIARSVALYRRGREVAEQEGNPAHATLIVSSLARTAFLSGDWTTARRLTEEGMEMLQTVDDHRLASYPLMARATLSLAEGEWESAGRDLEDALTIARSIGDRQAITSSLRLLAEVDLIRDRPTHARERLTELGLTDAWESEIDDAHLNVKITLARTFRALGEHRLASTIAAAVVDRARVVGESLIVPEVQTLVGMVATHDEDWDGAERAFDDAVVLARSFKYPFAEAQTLHAWGMMHLQEGDEAAARARLEEALAIFRRLGAPWYAQETERILTGLTE